MSAKEYGERLCYRESMGEEKQYRNERRDRWIRRNEVRKQIEANLMEGLRMECHS